MPPNEVGFAATFGCGFPRAIEEDSSLALKIYKYNLLKYHYNNIGDLDDDDDVCL